MTTANRPKHLPPASNALWDWIEDHKLNQRQTAQLIGIGYLALNRYLHNRRSPRLPHAVLIETATGIKAALWLDTHVGRTKKPAKAQNGKRAVFHSGNANV